MTLSYWHKTRRETTATFDVAVVGGGIIGCATAYWLRQRRPEWSVALVEARTLGSGASGRNAGFVIQGTDTHYGADVEAFGARTARRLWQFTRESRNLIESELDSDAFDLAARGSLTVAGTEDQEERLRASVGPMRGAGAPVIFLSAAETNRRLHAEGFCGSLFVTSGAMLDPLQLVRHVAAESEADVLEHHPVRDVRHDGECVVLETPVRRLEADRVMLAIGPHLPKLLPETERYVRPVRAQMLSTTAAPEQRLTVPAYTHDGEFYIRQAPDGSVLLGGARYRHAEAETGFEDATTPAVQDDLERYLHRHFPWAQSLDVKHRWSGTMGFSPDKRPVIGAVPEAPNSYWATGFTGHGMSYGFGFGRLMADLVVGERRPEGYELFRATRFDEQNIHSGTAT